jgi:HTH-type transcriptional regulator / antitoxin HipB
MAHLTLSQRIGVSIRLARSKSGLTQVALADQMGITQAQLSRYENGVDNLSITQMERLFDALGMDVDVVGTFKDEPNRTGPQKPIPE